jgi:hypothetical protein
MQALSDKNKKYREMKKTTHTAGKKSYARWSEDFVSPYYMFNMLLYFYLIIILLASF